MSLIDEPSAMAFADSLPLPTIENIMNPIQRYWYNKGHEDGRKLSTAILTFASEEISWGDRDDEWTKEIQDAHPLNTKDHKTYAVACEMVHNRHGKFALVALVNWLLRKAQENG